MQLGGKTVRLRGEFAQVPGQCYYVATTCSMHTATATATAIKISCKRNCKTVNATGICLPLVVATNEGEICSTTHRTPLALATPLFVFMRPHYSVGVGVGVCLRSVCTYWLTGRRTVLLARLTNLADSFFISRVYWHYLHCSLVVVAVTVSFVAVAISVSVAVSVAADAWLMQCELNWHVIYCCC